MANKNQRNMATINNTKKEEKNMNTKTTKTTTKKEEKNMKKNTEIVGGASVTLTKVGCGTITFVQPNEGDLVSYTVHGVTTKITADQVSDAVKGFKENGWKIGEIVEHNVATEDYSKTYADNLKKINSRKTIKSERKVATISKPTTVKKPTTYGEAITQKYGTEEHRKAVGAMTKVVASEWREQYLKTGKVVCKRSEYRQKLWAEAEKRVNEAEKKA